MTDRVALRCAGVSKEWSPGKPVLVDIDFDLRAGEWLGIIGPNGAGKSTLLHAITDLTSHQGSVTLGDGRRPGRTDLALVPQKPLLPEGMSVAEYVLMGRTAHLGWLARESAADRHLVAATLRRLSLGCFASRLVGELSGGEAQRVTVAHALVQQSPIVLLDEPTTALDIGHQSAVLELVDELRRSDGISVIAAMHDLALAARFSDRVVLLADGRIVAAGTPSEVLTEELLSAAYRTEVRVREIEGELVVLAGPKPT